MQSTSTKNKAPQHSNKLLNKGVNLPSSPARVKSGEKIVQVKLG